MTLYVVVTDDSAVSAGMPPHRVVVIDPAPGKPSTVFDGIRYGEKSFDEWNEYVGEIASRGPVGNRSPDLTPRAEWASIVVGFRLFASPIRRCGLLS